MKARPLLLQDYILGKNAKNKCDVFCALIEIIKILKKIDMSLNYLWGNHGFPQGCKV